MPGQAIQHPQKVGPAKVISHAGIPQAHVDSLSAYFDWFKEQDELVQRTLSAPGAMLIKKIQGRG